MTFKPTPSQLEAIQTIHCPLAVTAGAGSGKTRVLVERYLNLLHQGVSVDRIAAITFTKKAAQEMKDRLRKERPDLIESLEQAQISTIHSLCQRIISEHPLQAQIDPRFRVGEEWETQVLLMEIIEETVAEQDVPEELGTPQAIAELVFEVYGKMLSKGDADFSRFIMAEPQSIEFPFAQLCFAIEEFLTLTPQTAVQRQALEDVQTQWPAFQAQLSLPNDDLRLEVLEQLLALVKRIRGKLAELTADLKDLIVSAQGGIEENRGLEIISSLGEILAAVHKRYGQRKRDLGILDYNDLEQLAHELLQNPLVRADYGFLHLMVDEFQDTNPLQKEIVDALTAEGALLFVVGDPKQSIYRFRGADVGVFVQTKKEIAESGKNVFLAENFRSRPELIQFSNALFERLMEGEVIGFEASAYSKEAAHKPCTTILCTPAPELSVAEARVLEAEQIALKIRELVDSEQYQYKQISLLFRAMTSVHIYEKALKTVGIPYVNLSGRGFYSKQEIQDMMHYFRWLEDPADEVAHLAVLRSPFYLISDEGLFWIRQNRSEKLAAKEQEALRRSVEDYAELRALSLTKPAPVVITSLLEKTKYLEATWRLPFGPQKVANVEKLLEQAWDLYAQDVYTIPEQFRFLRIMVQDGQKEGEALLDAEHADVVVLRTIHGSKGLEFPVVFLPDTNGGVVRPQRGDVLYHPDFGLTYRGMQSYKDLKQQEEQEEISEAKRVLYVAITRAEEEFYWCCRAGKVEKKSWWAWLKDVLGELPPNLYREISAELPPLTETKDLGEVKKRNLPQYEALAPQYNQVSFSVTSLMNYARCPRYYFLRYILGVPERRPQISTSSFGAPSSLSGTQRGNIVHRVCEQIRDPKELGDLVDYAAAMEGVELEQRQKAQLEEIIMPYLKSEFFKRIGEQENSTWQVFQEQDFLIPAGEFLINGLVDQVFVGEKNLEVVDFKSNWIRSEQVDEVGLSYDVQLRLYAWAMAKEFGLQATRSQAYFLIPNRLYAIAPEFLQADETEKWLIETCQAILAGAKEGAEAFPIIDDCTLCRQSSYCGNAASFGENTGSTIDWSEGDSYDDDDNEF